MQADKSKTLQKWLKLEIVGASLPRIVMLLDVFVLHIKMRLSSASVWTLQSKVKVTDDVLTAKLYSGVIHVHKCVNCKCYISENSLRNGVNGSVTVTVAQNA